jgi:hypothetical protein
VKDSFGAPRTSRHCATVTLPNVFSGPTHHVLNGLRPSKFEVNYLSEDVLVEGLLSCLKKGSRWGPVQVTREFYYLRGRTDVVALTLSGDVVAFEAKLTKWRWALHQAYRNTCFAHSSYVVLPPQTALRAFRHAVEFERRHVGLCSVFEDGIVVLLDAPRVEPIQPWLTRRSISDSGAGGIVAHSA